MLGNTLALIVMLLLIGAGPASAQVEELTLRVDGLACPFCAYGVEKKLTKLPGTKSLDVRINEGKIIVDFRESEPLDLASLDEAVDKAGFTLRGVRGSFLGRVTKDDGRYFLVLPEPVAQRFFLYESTGELPHGSEGTAESLSTATRRRLDNALAEETLVRIVGPVHAHEDAGVPPALAVENLAVVSAPRKTESLSRN